MTIVAPEKTGFVERNGVRTAYDVYGAGPTTILLAPCWSIIHSRTWKAQVPFLAREYRVITFDGRGNGRSDRPRGAEAYRPAEYLEDALAVMDEAGAASAVIVGFSFGGHLAALLAARRPERVQGAVLISPAAPFGPANPSRGPDQFLSTTTSGGGSTRVRAR